MKSDVIIIGGGAAGFFTAARIAALRPDLKIIICEKSNKVLSKVRISGGGRCNVTHHCFDPRNLVNYYPRGGKKLIGAFTQFGPADTVKWFNERGVKLKTEEDGRMFPETDQSSTIVNCLVHEVESKGVKVILQKPLTGFELMDEKIIIHHGEGDTSECSVMVLAGGSSPALWDMISEKGISINDPVPSLFSFNIKDDRLKDMAGVSFSNISIKVPDAGLNQSGPAVITHWGLSGPAVLKLSSTGARILHQLNYRFRLYVNFLPGYNTETLYQDLIKLKQEHSRKLITGFSPFSGLTKRFWSQILNYTGIAESANWADISNKQLRSLAEGLTNAEFNADGKSTFKDEFVTCGGINLAETDLKTMSLFKYPKIYSAGEIMDVDAVTGGFNFQWAWTSGFIAGTSVANCFN